MNRTGLVIALGVAATAGLIFGIRPALDLELAGLFFDPERGGFWRSYDPVYAAVEVMAGGNPRSLFSVTFQLENTAPTEHAPMKSSRSYFKSHMRDVNQVAIVNEIARDITVNSDVPHSLDPKFFIWSHD